MKKLISGVVLAGAVLAPVIASALPGTAVMKTFYGQGVSQNQANAHAVAQSDAWEQALAERYGHCRETSVAVAEMQDGWHVTSVMECARL